MRYLYRKDFSSALEAEETAKGFALTPNIHAQGPVNVSVAHKNGTHSVYVEFEGEYDRDELFAATGYLRVTD